LLFYQKPFYVPPIFMKALLSLALISLLSATALADIQDPPINDYGPTRKLGRGLANVIWGWTELVQQPNVINEREGNAAAWTYVAAFIATLGNLLWLLSVRDRR
jgi:hypothetical protein